MLEEYAINIAKGESEHPWEDVKEELQLSDQAKYTTKQLNSINKKFSNLKVAAAKKYKEKVSQLPVVPQKEPIQELYSMLLPEDLKETAIIQISELIEKGATSSTRDSIKQYWENLFLG